MRLISKLFQIVSAITLKNNIDCSHNLQHSMDVLYYAKQITASCLPYHPHLEQQQRVIYVSAIVHDMIDHKYFANKEPALQELKQCLYKTGELSQNEIEQTEKIITTCSYSYIQKHGFPENMKEYLLAYHIVREADLLTSYSVKRSLMYNYNRLTATNKEVVKDAQYPDFQAVFQESNLLFQNRVFPLIRNGYFVTDYSRKKAMELHKEAIEELWFWKSLLEFK